MAVGGLQLPPATPSVACRAQLRSSLAGGWWVLPSRRSFMRTALVGSMAPGFFPTLPSMARSKMSAIPEVLKAMDWPEKFPFRPQDFERYDESSDKVFYRDPRFVTHIDDPAIKALTQYYAAVFPPANTPGVTVLDLCSSWISHYPRNYKQEKIVGLGLNEQELKRNGVLTEYVVQDLNVDPNLPFEDNSFDVITNAVSVDYLTKPLEIFKEMNRTLKPGGFAAMRFENNFFDNDMQAVGVSKFEKKYIDPSESGELFVSFSNRCFFTKAISIWTSTDDADHVRIVGSYFHYAGGFESPQALDISPNPGRSDPMYVVFAKKSTA